MSILKLKDDFNDPGQNNTRKHVPLNPSPPHPFCTRIRKESTILMRAKGLKALVNEDTLLRTHCCTWCFSVGLRKLGNICCGHKSFLNKVRNIFCVPDAKFVSTTNVAHAGNRGSICVGNNVSSFARAFTLVKAKGTFAWWWKRLAFVIFPVSGRPH